MLESDEALFAEIEAKVRAMSDQMETVEETFDVDDEEDDFDLRALKLGDDE
jgi:hypothetical protein